MKTYAALLDVDYVSNTGSSRCCGACMYLWGGGNTITCNRIDPPARVVPQGGCKLFKERDGEKDVD